MWKSPAPAFEGTPGGQFTSACYSQPGTTSKVVDWGTAMVEDVGIYSLLSSEYSSYFMAIFFSLFRTESRPTWLVINAKGASWAFNSTQHPVALCWSIWLNASSLTSWKEDTHQSCSCYFFCGESDCWQPPFPCIAPPIYRVLVLLYRSPHTLIIPTSQSPPSSPSL